MAEDVTLKDTAKGMVVLVGGGPGDPGLLTLKAKAFIQKADVIVYDHLVNPSILLFAKKDAELIYVGKQATKHTMKQHEINSLLVKKAAEGSLVVRLKGGDPFIFGRGGEEMEDLRKASIPFQVVPGITSAIAVPAYAGIPLTHREYASTVAFITGHEGEEKTQSSISWKELAKGVDTLVFLMGIGNLGFIVEQLISHGRSPDTPAAVIYKGTLPSQRTVTGPLKDIEALVREQNISPPGIIVVGKVVDLRKFLKWYENLPLFSKRILATRAKDQIGGISYVLSAMGAEVLEFPTIEFASPDSFEHIDRALEELHTFHWIIFTSANGVREFFERLFKKNMDARSLAHVKIATIGPKTAQELTSYGIKADLVPKDYKAEGLLDVFKEMNVKNKRLLIPRAQEAREALEKGLQELGVDVFLAPVYKTVLPRNSNLEILKTMFKEPVDMITFTSSSTVINFFKLAEMAQLPVNEITKHTIAACIGPITAKTAKNKGFANVIESEIYTVEALTSKIIAYFTSEKEGIMENLVKMYTLSTCGHCKATKKLLTDCGISYEFTDVDLLDGESRAKALEEVRRLNPNCSFPTIVIGDKVIVGYKEEEIKKALGIS